MDGQISNSSNNGNILNIQTGLTAGIIGYVYRYVIITDCYNTGNIVGFNGGGIVGSINDKGSVQMTQITNCYNIGNIDVSSNGAGGIVAYISSNANIQIASCYNAGNVTGSSTLVGGISGKVAGNLTIKDCYNIGNIRGISNSIGGIAAKIEKDSVVQNCYNAGTIEGGYGTAGIVGYNSLNANVQITSCYNVGTVIGSVGRVGGISGESQGKLTIKDCYNTGNISGVSNSIGGIAAETIKDSVVQNCYNSGIINGTRHAGGIVGLCRSDVYNCYNTGAIEGSNGGVCGTLLGDMTLQNVYNMSSTAGIVNTIYNQNPLPTMLDCYCVEGTSFANENANLIDLSNCKTFNILTYQFSNNTNLLTALNNWVETNNTTYPDSKHWQTSTAGYPVFVD